MKAMSREEKIQIYRGIIQTVGLIVMIVAIAWMVKNFNERKLMGECMYVDEYGAKEHTGLYGNCTWFNQRILRYRDMQQPDEGVYILSQNDNSSEQIGWKIGQ